MDLRIDSKAMGTLRLAHRAAASSALESGPNLKDRLERLDLDWTLPKQIRLPFTSDHKSVSADRAAKELERGQPRLGVRLEADVARVKSLEDVHELEVFEGLAEPTDELMEFLLSGQASVTTEAGPVSSYRAYNQLTGELKGDALQVEFAGRPVELKYTRGDEAPQRVCAAREFHDQPEKMAAFESMVKNFVPARVSRQLVRNAVKVTPERYQELFRRAGSDTVSRWKPEQVAELQAMVEKYEGHSDLDPIFESLKYRSEKGFSSWLSASVDEFSKSPGGVKGFGMIFGMRGYRAADLSREMLTLGRPLDQTALLMKEANLFGHEYSFGHHHQDQLRDYLSTLWKWVDHGAELQEAGELARRLHFRRKGGYSLDSVKSMSPWFESAEAPKYRQIVRDWVQAGNSNYVATRDYLAMIGRVHPARPEQAHRDVIDFGAHYNYKLSDLESVAVLMKEHSPDRPRDELLETLKRISSFHKKGWPELFQALRRHLPATESEISAYEGLLKTQVDPGTIPDLASYAAELKDPRVMSVVKSFYHGASEKAHTFLKGYAASDPEQRDEFFAVFDRARDFRNGESVREFMELVIEGDPSKAELVDLLLRGRVEPGLIAKICRRLDGHDDASAVVKQLAHAEEGYLGAYVEGILHYRDQGYWVANSRRKVAADLKRFKGNPSAEELGLYYRLQEAERPFYASLLQEPDLTHRAAAWEGASELPLGQRGEHLRHLLGTSGDRLGNAESVEFALSAARALHLKGGQSWNLSLARVGRLAATLEDTALLTKVFSQLASEEDPSRWVETLLTDDHPKERALELVDGRNREVAIEMDEELLFIGDQFLILDS